MSKLFQANPILFFLKNALLFFVMEIFGMGRTGLYYDADWREEATQSIG